VALGVLLPVVAGLLLLAAAWPGAPARRPPLVLWASAAVPLGFGLASCAFFVASLVAGASPSAALAGDAVLVLAAVGAAAWRRRARSPELAPETRPTVGLARLDLWALRCAALATLGLALGSATLQAWMAPHGEWDAWAIWNLRARFLVRAGAEWRDAFSPAIAWSHPDYPLLLPATVARLWHHDGTETVLAPILVGGLFSLATVGLLHAGVRAARGEPQALLATLTLLGTSPFAHLGVFQYADVPLGSLLLGALVLLRAADAAGSAGTPLLVASGTMLGLTAWTKNEGLLLVGAVLVARIAGRAGAGEARAWRGLGPMALGLLPVAAVVAIFKAGTAPPSELVAAQSLASLHGRLLDAARYREIGAAVGRELLGFDGWMISAVAVLAGYGLLAGLRPVRTEPAVRGGWVALALTATGYLVVYLVTPYPLPWHLRTSVRRLFLQLWPACLYCYWMTVRPVGDGGTAAGSGSAGHGPDGSRQ
jgi:hypothetical protein